jgi:drug/metabolite transporter (DMT)-like permease
MAPAASGRTSDPVPPAAGVLVSQMFNVVIYLTLAAIETAARPARSLSPSSVALFVAGGAAGSFWGRNLGYLSVLRIGAARSTAVRLTNTVFAVLLGFWLLNELPRPQQLVGAVLLTLGLWLVVEQDVQSDRRAIDWTGVAIAVFAALGFATGDTLRRIAIEASGRPLSGAALGAMTGLSIQLAWLAARGALRQDLRKAFRFEVFASAFFNTMAILLVFLSLQRTAVGNASALYNSQVLLVILIGRRMLRGDERVTGRLIAGSLVCAAGSAAILLG